MAIAHLSESSDILISDSLEIITAAESRDSAAFPFVGKLTSFPIPSRQRAGPHGLAQRHSIVGIIDWKDTGKAWEEPKASGL